MASTTPIRRITRSSMARFAYTGPDAKLTKTTTPDIEDIIPPATTDSFSSSLSSTRKRKRTLATSPTTPRRVKLEAVVDNDSLSTIATTSTPRRARKPARKKHDPTTGTDTVTAPSDWEELYAAAKTMRLPGGAAANAAVDTMGCERLADTTASPRDQRFHTLIALMLSSQTKDTTNAAAMQRLKTELPAHKAGAPVGLNLENILAVEPEVLNQLIWAVGFHNNKTRYIKQTAEILRDQWGGDIPDTIDGLVSLPGVGPKMAHLCLSAAWGRTEGIGVDVHVHRITNLWGWHKTKNPEETRMALQSWLPKEKWHEINWLLVGLGQTICAPVGRKCGECQLGLDGLCKAADRGKVIQGRKVREMKVEVVKKEEAKVVKVEDELCMIGVVPLPEEDDDVDG
ncbi:alpha,alpha-trehalase nth1 [Gnomoniopsis sp. IMI 355080]|nr:alpha,alpha-trehalase nth1 [Gnomoniopsis sp. IMI 355080]